MERLVSKVQEDLEEVHRRIGCAAGGRREHERRRPADPTCGWRLRRLTGRRRTPATNRRGRADRPRFTIRLYYLLSSIHVVHLRRRRRGAHPAARRSTTARQGRRRRHRRPPPTAVAGEPPRRAAASNRRRRLPNGRRRPGGRRAIRRRSAPRRLRRCERPCPEHGGVGRFGGLGLASAAAPAAASASGRRLVVLLLLLLVQGRDQGRRLLHERRRGRIMSTRRQPQNREARRLDLDRLGLGLSADMRGGVVQLHRRGVGEVGVIHSSSFTARLLRADRPSRDVVGPAVQGDGPR